MASRQHKLFYGSSYDRGLQHLLKMWPEIRMVFPDATLDVCYGWELFDRGYANNPERMAWKERINTLMEQPGVTHHGRISKNQVQLLQRQCGIWAYPTDFGETCCITALDCQAQGCVPCVIAYAALNETVGSGIKVEGDIYDDTTQAQYLTKLLVLMKDKQLWQQEQQKGIDFARGYTWDKIGEAWLNEFQT